MTEKIISFCKDCGGIIPSWACTEPECSLPVRCPECQAVFRNQISDKMRNVTKNISQNQDKKLIDFLNKQADD